MDRARRTAPQSAVQLEGIGEGERECRSFESSEQWEMR